LLAALVCWLVGEHAAGFGLPNAAGDGAAHRGERALGSDRAGVSPWGSDALGPTPLLFQTRPKTAPQVFNEITTTPAM